MVTVVIAVLGTLVVAEGAIIAHQVKQAKRAEADRDVEEAQAYSEAVQAAGKAGADGATAALAPALAELGVQLEVLQVQPAYCLADSGVYNETACLVDRCLAHAAVKTDGASKLCDELTNLAVSATGLTIIEAPPPGQDQGAPTDDDMTRRRTWLGVRK